MAPIITNRDKKTLQSTKFPPEFNQKVDTSKINLSVIKKWASDRLEAILGQEDEIVAELFFGLLEASKSPDIKDIQIQLSGFLGSDAPGFCKQLWDLCLSAQQNTTGVPQQLLDEMKATIVQKRQAEEEAREHVRRQRDSEATRDRELDDLRFRERRDRDFHGGGGGRDVGRRRPRDDYSRSPPRRRGPPRYDDRHRPARGTDSYVPSGQGRRHRSRSPRRSDRSRSRSRQSGDRRIRDTSLRRRRSTTPPRDRSPEDRSQKRRRRDDYSRSRSPRRDDGRHGRNGRHRSPSLSPQRRHRFADRADRNPRQPRSTSVDSRKSARSGSRSRSYDRSSPPRRRSPPPSRKRSPSVSGRSEDADANHSKNGTREVSEAR